MKRPPVTRIYSMWKVPSRLLTLLVNSTYVVLIHKFSIKLNKSSDPMHVLHSRVIGQAGGQAAEAVGFF